MPGNEPRPIQPISPEILRSRHAELRGRLELAYSFALELLGIEPVNPDSGKPKVKVGDVLIVSTRDPETSLRVADAPNGILRQRTPDVGRRSIILRDMDNPGSTDFVKFSLGGPTETEFVARDGYFENGIAYYGNPKLARSPGGKPTHPVSDHDLDRYIAYMDEALQAPGTHITVNANLGASYVVRPPQT